jgi:hypothetical protein
MKTAKLKATAPSGDKLKRFAVTYEADVSFLITFEVEAEGEEEAMQLAHTVRIFIAKKDSSGKIVEVKKTARVKALEKAANDLYAAAKKKRG